MIEAALVSCDDHLDLNMLPADALEKRLEFLLWTHDVPVAVPVRWQQNPVLSGTKPSS